MGAMRPESKTDEARVRVAALKGALLATGGQAKVRELYQLLTAEEAAEFLGTTTGTIRWMTSTRQLPCVKTGSRGVRYLLLDLVAWIEARRRPALQ